MARRKNVDLPPSRPEAIPLLRDCKDDPDNDFPRLTLAEWLEDRFDPRGMFVRSQVDADRRVKEGRPADEAWSRAAELACRHASAWMGGLVRKGAFQFTRGLADMQVHPRWFLGPTWSGFAGSECWEWVETVRLAEVTDAILERLVDSSLLPSVGGVVLRVDPDSTLPSFLRLMHSPTVSAMRWISLLREIDPESSSELGRILGSSAALAGLRGLWLNVQPLGAEAVRAIADSAFLGRLSTLGLVQGSVGNEGLRLLAESPHLAHIRHLAVTRDAIDLAGIQALVASRHLSGLRTLDLSFNQIGNEAVRELANSRALENLDELVLTGNPLDESALRGLRESPHLRSLRTLRFNS